MNKKKNHILIIVFIVGIVSCVITGLTYAYWVLTKEQTGENVITSGCLKISLSNKYDGINIPDTNPITDEKGRTLEPYNFDIYNECNNPVSFTLSLEMLDTTNLESKYVKTLLSTNFSNQYYNNPYKLVGSKMNFDLPEEVLYNFQYENEESNDLAYFYTGENPEDNCKQAMSVYESVQKNYHNMFYNLYCEPLYDNYPMIEEPKLLNEYSNETEYNLENIQEGRILRKETLLENGSISYSLRLWVDNDAGNESMNKEFHSKITAKAEIEDENMLKPFNNAIKGNKDIPGIYFDRLTSDYYSEYIDKIIFETPINQDILDDNYTYDLSLKQDKSIISYFDNNDNILHIQSDSKIILNPDSSFLFAGYENLESIEGLENVDTSKVANMSYMFADNPYLRELDLSNFDTSKVTNMSGMFYNSPTVVTVGESFNTSNVINMSYMFYNNNFINLFSNCNNYEYENYKGCVFDTSNVTDMSYMFGRSDKENLVTYNSVQLDTSQVRNMEGMFYNNSSELFNIGGNFNTSNVTNMSYMFYGNDNINLISNCGSDYNCKFDTSNVTDMSYMFANISSNSELPLDSLDTKKVQNMKGMFANSNIYWPNGSFEKTYFLNTSNVTDMSYMFWNHNLGMLENYKLNTRMVTNMQGMFYNAQAVNKIDYSSFDTKKVNDMSYMFYNCDIYLDSDNDLDISSFNTSNVLDMSYMFNRINYYGNQKIIYGPKFVHNPLAKLTGMFDDYTEINKPNKDVDSSWENVSFD